MAKVEGGGLLGLLGGRIDQFSPSCYEFNLEQEARVILHSFSTNYDIVLLRELQRILSSPKVESVLHTRKNDENSQNLSLDSTK